MDVNKRKAALNSYVNCTFFLASDSIMFSALFAIAICHRLFVRLKGESVKKRLKL